MKKFRIISFIPVYIILQITMTFSALCMLILLPLVWPIYESPKHYIKEVPLFMFFIPISAYRFIVTGEWK